METIATPNRGGRIGSGGRSATFYAAEALTSPEPGGDSFHPPPEVRLCVKIARPNRCRTLAREAWVSQQLRRRGRKQGVIALRYHEFFAAPLDFPLWKTKGKTKDFDLDVDDDEPTLDSLPDDDVNYGDDDGYGR